MEYEINPNSYLGCAENDYEYFRCSYDLGLRKPAMAAMGQNTCEKYLKHLIATYAEPLPGHDAAHTTGVFRAHSLRKLIQHIERHMNIDIPADTKNKLNAIDGFYSTTRYPGDDFFIPSSDQIEEVSVALEACRNFTFQAIQELEASLSNTERADEYEEVNDEDYYRSFFQEEEH